jgi:indole-3-glycerol phosphate synthase
LITDRSIDPTEHLPNSYISRRSTEAQAVSAWTPPGGTLGELTDEARARAATLSPRKAELTREAHRVGNAPGFASALKCGDVAIIAEVKRSSPSRGVINSAIDVTAQVGAYEAGGAAAVSVLTEPSRFGGSNEDLVRAHRAAGIPLLKKDFHVDVLQILEAKILGASAALLIVRALPPAKTRELAVAAHDVGLEILVEVRTEAELELALSLDARVIGVNSRDLETLIIDPDTPSRIIPLIPSDRVAVAESGVQSRDDIDRLAGLGADAVLVGSAISASTNPEVAVRALTGVAANKHARKN